MSETKPRKPKTTETASRLPELATVRVADLRPHPSNPNKHPETQIEHLMASLRRDGQTRPIMARKANMMIIGGHGIHTAARRLGWETLQVQLLDVDDDDARRIMLGDQKLTTLSELDRGRVAELMKEINEVDWLATGYTQEEGAKLFEAFKESDLEVFEIETSNVTDHFWIAARGPLAEQAAVLQQMKQLLREYPSVTIEVGTVEDQ